MSATTSAATGRCFGIQRVCQVWERSRSALYARRARAHHHRLGAGPARRGPPPRQSDAQLLAAIRTDLARSPFHGEGHRKVHARLRILDGIRVARTRVLRVMRAHGLLSPHRGRQGAAKTHDGRVITQAPNVMWGTDGVRVFTLDDEFWAWHMPSRVQGPKPAPIAFASQRRSEPHTASRPRFPVVGTVTSVGILMTVSLSRRRERREAGWVTRRAGAQYPCVNLTVSQPLA